MLTLECDDVADSGRSFHIKNKLNRSRGPNAPWDGRWKRSLEEWKVNRSTGTLREGSLEEMSLVSLVSHKSTSPFGDKWRISPPTPWHLELIAIAPPTGASPSSISRHLDGSHACHHHRQPSRRNRLLCLPFPLPFDSN